MGSSWMESWRDGLGLGKQRMPSCQNVATSLLLSSPFSAQTWTLVNAPGLRQPGYKAFSQGSPAHYRPHGISGQCGPCRGHSPMTPFHLLHQSSAWSSRQVTCDWERKELEKSTWNRHPPGQCPCPVDRFQLPWHGPRDAGKLSSISLHHTLTSLHAVITWIDTTAFA